MDLFANEAFRRDYAALRFVSLHPERHFAENAQVHTQLVVERTRQLCAENGMSEADTERLTLLAYLHDIGKSRGTSRPQQSVELLAEYGITELALVKLVKYHDLNLPWYISHERGETPSDKAWRKLARETDLRLLCLFMIADRIDCPGGFRENAALTWFWAEADKRGYLTPGLRIPEADVGANKPGGLLE